MSDASVQPAKWFLATVLMIAPDGRPTAQTKLFPSTSERDAKAEVTDELLNGLCVQGWAIRELGVTALSHLVISLVEPKGETQAPENVDSAQVTDIKTAKPRGAPEAARA